MLLKMSMLNCYQVCAHLEYSCVRPPALDFGVSSSKGLFPSIFNLGTHAEVRANSSCGSGRQEQYCTLGDSKDPRYGIQGVPRNMKVVFDL